MKFATILAAVAAAGSALAASQGEQILNQFIKSMIDKNSIVKLMIDRNYFIKIIIDKKYMLK